MSCDGCKYFMMCVRRYHKSGRQQKCENFEPDQPHGEWKEYNVSTFRGTDEFGEPKWGKGKKFICKRCLRVTVIRENFCPNCGADMRKEGEKNEIH